MISKQWLFAAGASTVLAFGVAACGDDSDDTTSESGGDTPSGLSGSITIDGSSTVQPFAEAAAELFNAENPDVNITVGAAGTSGGFEKFCAGETDISNASRSIEPEEEDLCNKDGVQYSEVQVANDGISVVTNPELAISCLSVDQLSQLWSDDTVTNYSELGDDADSGEAIPDSEVSLYGPGTDSGTFDYFTDTINGEEGKSRQDYQASEDDNVLVQGVSGDSSGLAYFGFSYYEQNADTLNLVSVDDGSGCVAPSAETIQDGSYKPLSDRCSCIRPTRRSRSAHDGLRLVAAHRAVAAVAEHGAAGRGQRVPAPGERVGLSPACGHAALADRRRRMCLRISSGAVVGVAGAAGRRRVARRQSGRQLLLRADGAARDARRRRTGRLDRHDANAEAWRRRGLAHPAVRALLALPARGVGGAVRGDRAAHARHRARHLRMRSKRRSRSEWSSPTSV